jgi:tetratricopeptide (TPR) repeat protein
VAEPSTSLISELTRLYDTGRFISAWHRLKDYAPAEEWTNPGNRVFASRLLRYLGANNRGDRLILRTWRRFPSDPEVNYFLIWTIAGFRGLWRALQKNRELARGNDITPALLAHIRVQEADILSRLRDFRRAEPCFKQAEELAPADPWTQVCIAYHYERMDRLGDAIQVIEAAYEKNPSYPHLVTGAAHLFQMAGRDDDAIAVLERACRETENSAAATGLVSLLRELGLHDRAEEAMENAERFMPLAEESVLQWRSAIRAGLAYRKGDFQQAAEWAGKSGEDSFSTAFAERLKNPDPARRRVELPVGFVKQHHLTCVPATLTTLSRYWNRPADHLEVSQSICYNGTPSFAERRWAETNGWIAREFKVTMPAARTLLDRGIPFAFTTVHPGGGHEQAIIGYDDYRGTLLIRDPYLRNQNELLTDKGLDYYASSGPRGMTMVPHDRAELLAGIDLPEADLYDHHHTLLLDLDRHDRAAAAAALARLEHLAPGNYLTLQSKRALAAYDANLSAHLSALEELLLQFPKDANYQLARLGLLRDLVPRPERLKKLSEACAVPDSDPLLWQELAGELVQDARQLGAARGWLKRAARIRPVDPFNHYLQAGIAWDQGRRDEALELYRLAACIDDKRESYAQSYFRAARAMGRTSEALDWLQERFEREAGRSNLPGRTLVWAYNELNRTADADATLNEAIRRRPEDAELRLFAVAECAGRRNMPAAEGHLEAAKGKASFAAWSRAAAHLAYAKDDPTAEMSHWRETLAAEPMAMDAHQAVARLLLASEGRTRVLEHLAGYVARFPYYSSLRLLYIHWLGEEGEQAKEAGLRDLLRVDPRNAWAWRELAGALVPQRRFDEARQALEVAAEIEPESGGLFNMRGQLFALTGDSAAARAEYRRALELSADSVWSIRSLLDECSSGEQRREAIAFVQREIIRQVTAGDGIFEFATQARAYLPPDELLKFLEQAHAARPDLWQTWSALARQYGADNRMDDAMEIVKRAVERFPMIPRLWLDLSKIHHIRLEKDDSIRALQKVRELAPGWGSAMQDLATALAADGKMEEGIRVLEDTVIRSPQDTVLRATLGSLQRRAGRPAAAIESFRQAVLTDPGYEWAWNALKETGNEAGSPDIAPGLAEELLQRRPADARSWFIRAKLLDQPGDRPRRMELLHKALELDPGFLNAHVLLANTHAADGNWEAAFGACRPAIFGENRPPELGLCEALLRARRGNAAAGIELLETVLKAHPGFEAGWRQLARLKHMLGDDDGAISASEQVALLSPNDPLPLGYLGEIKLRRNDLEGAENALRRAFEIDPEYLYAGRSLVRIYLLTRETDRATAVLQRLRPYIGVQESRALEIKIARASGDRNRMTALLAGMLADPTGDADAFAQITDAVKLEAKYTAPIIEAAFTNPKSNAETGRLWVAVASRKELLRRLRRLDKLGFGSEMLVQAWQHCLGRFGDQFGEASHRNDVLHLYEEWRVFRVVSKRRDEIQSRTDLWGQTGYIYARAGRWRSAAKWLAGWKRHPEASPWMLSNLLMALVHSDDDRELRAVLEALPVRRTTDPLDLRVEMWKAAFRLAEGDTTDAERFIAQIAASSLGEFDRPFHAALEIWTRFIAGSSAGKPGREEKQILIAYLARYKGMYPLRRLFTRLTVRMGRKCGWRFPGLWSRWHVGFL